MRPLRIDFVPPTRWRLVWAVCAVFVLVIAGAFAWKASKLVVEAQATDAEMERIKFETDRLRQGVFGNGERGCCGYPPDGGDT